MKAGTALIAGALMLGCISALPPSADERPPAVEAISLLGQPLERPELPLDIASDRMAKLENAERELLANPDSPEALIWLGRRLAYLGRYREAIEVFSRGIERFPDDARFLRHRGHRYITTRSFDAAIEDLSRAARMIDGRADEVEPDGLPNARNIPTTTLHSNIWYHLGLAHYLKGDWEGAHDAYRRGFDISRNPDGLVSMTYWLYLTLRRLERDEEAGEVLERISPDLDVIENHAYHQLLLMYRSHVSEDDVLRRSESTLENATLGYGVGCRYLFEGDRDRAYAIFRDLIDSPEWAAFGYIAAEAELARSR